MSEDVSSAVPQNAFTEPLNIDAVSAALVLNGTSQDLEKYQKFIVNTEKKKAKVEEQKKLVEEKSRKIHEHAKNMSCDCVTQELMNYDDANQQTSAYLYAKNHARFFRDQYNKAYLELNVGEHTEIWPVKSERFNNWITQLYFKHKKSVPSRNAMSAAQSILEADAQERRHLFLRFGEKDGKFYVDACDKEWTAFEITSEGWKRVSSPQIFRREDHMLEFKAEPVAREEEMVLISDYQALLSPMNEDTAFINRAWHIAALVPELSCAMPVIFGPEGSGKSMTTTLMRQTVDPSSVKKLTIPKDPREFIQILSQHAVPFFDNERYLDAEKSDILCVSITHGTVPKRELYTDNGTVYQDLKCKPGMNGRTILAQESDLLRRSILQEHEIISDEQARPEPELISRYAALESRLRGALLNILSRAMSVYPSIKGNVGSMPGFARWGEAASQAMGFAENAFFDKYEENVKKQSLESLNAHVIGRVMEEFLQTKEAVNGWTGYVSELLAKLNGLATMEEKQQKYWPKAAHVLSRKLVELKRPLYVGTPSYTLETGIRDKKGNKLTLKRNSSKAPLSEQIIDGASVELGGASTSSSTAVVGKKEELVELVELQKNSSTPSSTYETKPSSTTEILEETINYKDELIHHKCWFCNQSPCDSWLVLNGNPVHKVCALERNLKVTS